MSCVLLPGSLLASISSLSHVLLLPTMRPLLLVLICPVVCVCLCGMTDGFIHVVERLRARRLRNGDRLVELKPTHVHRRSHARLRTV